MINKLSIIVLLFLGLAPKIYAETITPVLNGNFSSGDMMICILLLVLIIIKLVELLRTGLSSVKIIREFQGNNSQDGKEFYKI